MKSAIYIANGLTQFVLTPESKTDESVLADMEQNLQEASNTETVLRLYRGNFYRCSGGWIRRSDEAYNPCFRAPSDHSLIFVMEKKLPVSAPLTIGGTVTGFQTTCDYCRTLGSACASHETQP